MTSKLKKKTKINQIVFPHQYRNQDISNTLFPEQKKRPVAGSKPIEKLTNKQHYSRLQSKSKEPPFFNQSKILKRSFSHLNTKTHQVNSSTHEKPSHLKAGQTQSIQKLRKNSVAAQFSRLLSNKMQQNLVKECQTILKYQTPMRCKSLCKMQKVSQNLFTINRKIQPQPQKMQIQLRVCQGQQVSLKPVSIQQIAKSELEVVRVSQIQKQTYSHFQIGYSQQNSQQRSIIHDSAVLRKNSLIVDRKMQSIGQSLINSQSRDGKLINLINSANAYIVSSKILVRSSGFFVVRKIEFSPADLSQLSILLQFCGETVYKKISALQQKRIFDVRSRKNHLKKLHQLKEKMKQKIFIHFSRVTPSRQVLPFFQDLLSFIEQCLTLERTYLGLVFTDYEELNFSLINQERLQNLFKGKQSFYFLMKLRGTYYLVKADSNANLQAKFTLVIDFTSLACGDQLMFQYHAPLGHHSLTQAKIYRLLPKIAQDFIQNATRKWGSNNAQGEVKATSAKIGKVMVQNLQKWSGKEADSLWDTLWDISKRYTMVGQRKTFFVFHSQFDYGFFKTAKFQRTQAYNYRLTQNCGLSYYRYPHSYRQIKLSQIQMQALVIPHLPMSHKQIKKHVVTTFFHKQETERKKAVQKTFKMVVNNFRVQLQLSEQLQIYFQSIKNYRGYKLVVPNQKQKVTVPQLTNKIFALMKDYKIRVSLIYSKLSDNRDSVVVLYKGLHKFQMQFVYVTLYKITRLSLVEFRVHAFKMSRTFVVRLQNFQESEETLKENVNSLISYFKTVYFKTFLHEEARKSKKRRKDALEDFLKNQVKANPNNLRPKRKVQGQKRRKMMRLASMKWCEEGNNVNEDIISRIFYTSKGQLSYLTMRYLPLSQVELLKVPEQEIIEMRVYFAGKIAHFKYQLPFKELMSVVKGKGKHEVSSLKEMYQVLKQVADKIQQIVEKPYESIEFLFLQIKTFIDPNYSRKEEQLHPFKFKIIGNNFFETKVTQNQDKSIATRLSIDLNLRISHSIKLSSLQGSQNIKEALKDSSFDADQVENIQTEICKPIYTFVKQKWIVKVIDIVREQEEWALLAESKRFERQIKVTDRDSNRSYILSQGEGYFLGGIQYQHFNKRMIKRVIRSIKMAL